MNPKTNTRGVQAIRAGHQADRLRKQKARDPFYGVVNRLHAEKAQAEADTLMKPPAAFAARRRRGCSRGYSRRSVDTGAHGYPAHHHTSRMVGAVGPFHSSEGAMAGNQDGRAPGAERSAAAGICEQCGAPFRGRPGKRFCRDACRTRFGRERKARNIQETITRLAQLAGVEMVTPVVKS